MEKNELREIRKQKFAQMEQKLHESWSSKEDLLHYCNILYEMLPTILMSSYYREEKDSRILAAISVVSAGYGGDMDDELANELLDDMDFHYKKVKCRKIEQMLPKLMKMVEGEMKNM